LEDREKKLRELLKGRPVGKGRFRTRLNWGFWLLLLGFLLFAVTMWVLLPIIRGG